MCNSRGRIGKQRISYGFEITAPSPIHIGKAIYIEIAAFLLDENCSDVSIQRYYHIC